MSLQFIIGSSGAGKSYFGYQTIIEESIRHPDTSYFVIVPEQFTMQTQKTLVDMHPGKGILNIDILSFERLAYRVFEETGGDHRKLLEETGKSMVLLNVLPMSAKIKNSVLFLDGFTGFTPIQNKVIRELLAICQKVYVTVTLDDRENPFAIGKPHQLFFMSRKMIHTLAKLTKEVEESILIPRGDHSRFAVSPALGFMEQHLFRYRKASYEKEQDEIHIFSAASP